MIRDYADMLWSSYNFWCKVEYDGAHCDYSKWADPLFHKRSPELFHDLLLADSNGTEVVQPFYYPMHRPCANAGGYYTEYIDFYLYRNGLRNRTLIVASEELESFPLQVVTRVAHAVGASVMGINLQNFTKVRINSQENKGTTHSVAIERYRHGLYNISGYRPMLPATREFVNACWREDCLAISRHTGYNYSACMDASAATGGKSSLISLPLGLNNL
jgi:hypothetical protein